jgi:hypothetical protein
MAYAAIVGIAACSPDRLVSDSGIHRDYVPIHIATYFGAAMTRLSAFPMWYMAEAGILYPAFVVALWRLQPADEY